MMLILLIEDDENKRSQIEHFIIGLNNRYKLIKAKSYNSGLKNIISKKPDFILLDMTMPTYDIGINEDGGRPQHYAGREILRQMDRRKLDIPTWIITGFDCFGEGESYMSREQLDKQLRNDHQCCYKGTIFFNSVTNDWKDPLAIAIDSIANKVTK